MSWIHVGNHTIAIFKKRRKFRQIAKKVNKYAELTKKQLLPV